MTSDTSKFWHDVVACLQSHPRKPRVAIIHIFATFFEVKLGGHGRIKGEGNEQQSDRAENHRHNKLYLDRFEVQKVRLLIKNALCLYSELCFLPERGAQFQKNHEKSGRKVKNGAGRP